VHPLARQQLATRRVFGARRFAAASKLAGKYLDDCLDNTNNPIEGEVSRAENYNADKPSRNVRYIGADKRKGQLFQARRQFGSGWGKQL